MRLAFDTSLLAYAEGIGDAQRCGAAKALPLRLLRADKVLPVQVMGEQVMGEPYRVLTAKCRQPPAQVKQTVDRWADTHTTRDSTLPALRTALELCADHRPSIWDSLIPAVAAVNGCAMLLSEDMPHGFYWRGVTVVNPFEEPIHPLLATALA